MATTDILSIQLYTLRLLADPDIILDIVAEAGYRHVETIGSHLDDAAATAKRLQQRGLTATSSHVSLAALSERPQEVIAACHTLGLTQLFMPAVPPDQRGMAAEGWTELGQQLGKIAEAFQRDGIGLGYHNHNWEMTPKQGDKTALELIFEAAGGAPLTWQVDVAWLARAGVDPKMWMDRYHHRIVSAHVKDLAPSGEKQDEDGWADVGAGVLDWHELWRACRAHGARTMVVEHDKPSDPRRSVRASFAFLRAMEV